MDEKQRNKRLRLLIKRLNKERKKQAKKIDILCDDIISAQRNFIQKLDAVSFAANFYKSIVGVNELSSLLHISGKNIKDEIGDANVAFFLRQAEVFELHLCESDQPIGLEQQRFENCFSPSLVANICKANKICSLDDMFTMGLQGNLNELNKISAVTIPLGCGSSSTGFILIYRCSANKLTARELNNIRAVRSGLSRAIACCQMVSPIDSK